MSEISNFLRPVKEAELAAIISNGHDRCPICHEDFQINTYTNATSHNNPFDELDERCEQFRATQSPIERQDITQGAMALSCNHIFCGTCITKWFGIQSKRERQPLRFICACCRGIAKPFDFYKNNLIDLSDDGQTNAIKKAVNVVSNYIEPHLTNARIACQSPMTIPADALHLRTYPSNMFELMTKEGVALPLWFLSFLESYDFAIEEACLDFGYVEVSSENPSGFAPLVDLVTLHENISARLVSGIMRKIRDGYMKMDQLELYTLFERATFGRMLVAALENNPLV